ncbi:MAG: glycosyltransferase family 2 protein [Lachnospiraceae bacterium]|nr:glycosyltransferase family 2 protein [Lachnospiraceae bacterium]
MEKLAVILVNYNGKQYNEACIESLLANQTSFEQKIIVVDNASKDDSIRVLKERYGTDTRVELIALEDNYGFSYANNVGIRKAMAEGADYVLLLNNDTEISEDMLTQLEACAKRHPDSMIAPKIYYSDHRDVIWSAGGKVSPMIRKVSHIGIDQVDRGQFEEEIEIGFATGCALLIPRGVIEQAGLLDEDFFLYYEDTEYSLRLAKMGIPIYFCPKAVMYHKVGASSKGADSPLCAYYIARNWLICNKKHLRGRYLLFLVYYVINRSVCCLFWLAHGKAVLVQATWRGIRDFQQSRYGKSRYYG